MSTIPNKPSFSTRCFLASIITIAFLETIFGFFATPAWVFMFLLGLIILWISGLGWTLLADRQSEFAYLMGLLILILLTQAISRHVHLPDWWNDIPVIMLVFLVPWSIWYKIRERRNTANKQANTTE
ncbi:MAG: hypothetical protein AAGF95_04605 [Chloroflexota bacterium]